MKSAASALSSLSSLLPHAGWCAAVLLAGCAAPVQVTLDTATPAQWTQPVPAPGAAAVDMRAWWKPWGDAQLNALVDEALAHNLTVAQAGARLRQQRLQARGAQGVYRPQLSGGVRTLQDISATDSYFQASIDMVWDMGLFGALEAGERAAHAQVLDAGARLQAARVALVAEVVHRYLDLRLAQRQRHLLDAMAQQGVRALQLAQVRQRERLGTQAEVQQLQAQAHADAASAAQLAQAQAGAAHALAALLGRTQPDAAWLQPNAQADVPHTGSPAFSALPAQLLRTRPDIQLAEAQVEQAAADVGMARSALYPRLQLTGSLLYSYNLTQNFRTTADNMPVVGPLLDIPLFDWARRRSQAEASEQALQAAVLAYRQSVLDGVAEVESSLAALAAQHARAQALQAAQQLTRAQGDAQRTRQRLGLGSEWAALPAQRAQLQAHSDIATAQAARALAYVALYKALGGAPLPPADADVDAAPAATPGGAS